MVESSERRKIKCLRCKESTTASKRKYSRGKEDAEKSMDVLFNDTSTDLTHEKLNAFYWLVSEKTWRCDNCGSKDVVFEDDRR